MHLIGKIMKQAKIITKEQALRAIQFHEFGDDIIASSQRVAVLLTQDWCPQWAAMRDWIYSLDYDFDLYELIYNKVDYFSAFRNFKETIWKNGLIPYVRYYNAGTLTSFSNYVSKEEFLKNLGL
jgi:hypothetical protein